MRWNRFFRLVAEDFKHHGALNLYQQFKVFFFNDSFQLLFNTRLLNVLNANKIPIISFILIIIIRYVNLIVFSSIISAEVKIGSRCMFIHPIGIVIGRSTIGDDVKIFQQVTIGSKGNKDQQMSYPHIGNKVTIYAHTVLLGNINIGNNVVVAANSVVIKDLGENGIYAGSPSKKIN